MNKFILTGSTGHVGSVLNNELTFLGNDVVCLNKIKLDRGLNYSYDELFSNKFFFAKGFLEEAILLHCASAVDFNNSNIELSNFNVLQTHRLLNFFKTKGLNRVVLISSAQIVGESMKFITEEDPPCPQTVYHLSKYYQEKLVELLNFKHYYNLRISSPISPSIKKNNIFKVFLDRAVKREDLIIKGKGSRLQNYIDVRDIALTINNIAKNNFNSGTYNICSENSISNLELAKLIIDISNTDSKIKLNGKDETDDIRWKFDTNLAKIHLNYRQTISLEKTIKDYLEKVL